MSPQPIIAFVTRTTTTTSNTTSKRLVDHYLGRLHLLYEAAIGPVRTLLSVVLVKIEHGTKIHSAIAATIIVKSAPSLPA